MLQSKAEIFGHSSKSSECLVGEPDALQFGGGSHGNCPAAG